MELKSSLEDRVLKLKMLVVLVTPKDRDSLVELLQSMPKRAKMDRLDEYMLNSLINALENPEACVSPQKELPFVGGRIPDGSKQPVQEPRKDNMAEPTSKDKIRMVSEIKSRLDPKNLKNMSIFIQESISFGKTSFGIKTDPVDSTEESFFNWLTENRIVNMDGSPVSNRN